MNKQLRRFNASGFVVSGPGMSGEIEGPLEVLLAGAIGAMIGFIVGRFCGVLARIFTLNRAQGIIGGNRWAAYGAGAGALALALVELID